MFKWEIAEKKSDNLVEHLLESRKSLDKLDFGDCKTEDFFGTRIPDKKLLKDIIKAASRIIKAVKKNEKIVIFGHDDVDGITSTYLLFDFLTMIGSYSHYYYIPNRLTDHHGIKETFIESVIRNKYSLVVTVDGGVSSIEGIEQLNSLGCDVIITDHHLIPSSLPSAYAIVNPKQDDCSYPDKMLAGVGVVYFLLAVISEILDLPLADKYLFWAAVGTISDKAPMVGVNRIICKTVFDNWSNMIQRPLSLWSSYIPDQNCDYFEKSCYIWNMVKLLSSGRDKQGENSALYFLLSPDYKQREIVSELIRRKTQYENDVIKVRNVFNHHHPSSEDQAFFFFDDRDQIPFALMGFAGNFLSSLYKVPVFIMKYKRLKEATHCEDVDESEFNENKCIKCTNNTVVGEGKCPDKFDLIAALDYCKASLIQYGGHKRAAGFVTDFENLENFKKLFKEYVESVKEQIEASRILKIDAEITKSELKDLKYIISIFSPFGESAPSPVFLIRNIRFQDDLPDAVYYEEKENLSSMPYDVVFTYRCDGRIVILDVKQA